MRSTLIGLGIIGFAILIGWSSRDNTNETAAQTFGTLGLILVLVLVGLKFVRAGEQERLRNKGRKRMGGAAPPKYPSAAIPAGAPGVPGMPAAGSSTSEVQKMVAVSVVALLLVLGGGYTVKTFLLKSDFERLAEMEDATSLEQGKNALEPLLDKTATRFGRERSEIDSAVYEVWEANEVELRLMGLKPSSFVREVLQAAPRGARLEPIANALLKEEPAARLARLHQKKPAPGKYPQQAEFAKYLQQLSEKTGLDEPTVAAALVRQWRAVFQKKKSNRKYNLLWFVKHVNSKTKKGTDGGRWTVQLAEIGHAI